MQTAIKVIAAVLVVALIVVIGLIYLRGQNNPSQVEITATSEVAMTEDTTATPQPSQEPEENPTTEPNDASLEAQDEAQGNVYEGALAGMTEEEIEKQALAEEAMEGVHVETND